jgi:hypothetical protein
MGGEARAAPPPQPSPIEGEGVFSPMPLLRPGVASDQRDLRDEIGSLGRAGVET